MAAWICHQAKMSPTSRQPASLNSRIWNDSSLDKGSEENVHHNRVEWTLHRLHFCATYHISPLLSETKVLCLNKRFKKDVRFSLGQITNSLSLHYTCHPVKSPQYALSDQSASKGKHKSSRRSVSWLTRNWHVSLSHVARVTDPRYRIWRGLSDITTQCLNHGPSHYSDSETTWVF